MLRQKNSNTNLLEEVEDVVEEGIVGGGVDELKRRRC